MRNKGLLILLSLATLLSVSAQEISSEFPYESKYLEVLGSTLHYVEEYVDGNSDQLTFLFLHGNPTSSYLWRNVIPYVEGQGRAIAIDLIGMGKSDKPDIDYTFQDHTKYVEEFIRLKELKNIVLVLHDWGSGLGFHYASRYEDAVVGIAFMEAITKPMKWKDANMMERFIFKRFRDEMKGHKMIAENNFFVEMFLFKFGIRRKLTDEEKAYYKAPYPAVKSRKPIEVWPKEIPIEQEPYRNYQVVSAYRDWLEQTPIPKLLLYASPGMIIKEKEVEQMKESFQNLEAVYVGKGRHYIQEDNPHEIGRALKKWSQTLSR